MKLLRTILPAPLEHFVAYAGVAAIAMAAYIPSRVGARIIGGLCVYAGILEYIRHFSPGRHPSLGKFAGSALGALCGVLAVALCYGVARPISRAEFFKIVPRALMLSALPTSSHGSHPCRSRNRGSSKTSTLTSS
jgi:hypothetical protein